jgi:hypothetical protein
VLRREHGKGWRGTAAGELDAIEERLEFSDTLVR